ncbi:MULTISPECIES: ATP-dependent zinc metalloprotease FtsH [unclassified Breznakia]|uniref:ATP-dependent zinc metalloprotease FtsH n=1 Tax=unclassified Breznakia TaxID=2623764 RepID=UPI0024742C94|nr:MULTISPECIES: ATP-dependent zinc metalloprotease FtsH [unclassified Breznakia]MDH6366980.1 cell division protease FtsH [Breznakia sp. PH1-1]MDH6404248.1 cell division protease FtsH [Breznakia sp. PF1-11]MDH6411867.1 cell division protease FtsH [Breznakia sp. PFB1-11]MDH6414236.1 cell division protease FtsH [Breznakia sp. PFB1-14]MDH6415940.1 cell division protease FtsH [Breznakia sp. PFB1-4]
MKNNKRNPLLLLPYLLLALMLIFLLPFNNLNETKEFTYNEFAKKAEKMDFQDVSMGIGTVTIEVEGKYKNNKDEDVAFSATLPKTDENIEWLQKTLDSGKNKVKVYEPDDENILLTLFINFFPILLLGGFVFVMFSRMGGGQQNKAFEFSKSRAKVQGNIKTRFKDVAGADEEKEEVKEIIDYLKNPKRFSDMGARIPKGMLMVGPPGTGKTLLAKAVAGEADVPFFSISGSDFVEMFVGTGASRVRDMFKKAKQAAPCIVFIDEIDAVGRQRGAGMGGGNDEREQTLNQLLVEMDGMEENIGIVIIAATNRPDVLDPALLRSGRFDRQITVSLPDKKGRTEILEVHARNKKLAPDVTLENLAKRTPGFSGADLENVLNEGAILAVRGNRKLITMDDLDEAVDRVMMGPAKKSKKYSDTDKKLVAYHEAGHAVIGIKLEDADMVQKVTIIPRGDAGGYNLMTPREEKYFHRKKEYMAQITGLLGGRVSEELVFGEISAGAVNDIEKITKIAKAMVRVFGMSTLGPIQYADPQGNVFLGRDYNQGAAYSGEVAFEIDQEVRKIVNECYDECKRILVENRDLLDLIANSLIEEETLTSEQINNLVEYGTLDAPKQDVEAHEETIKEQDEKMKEPEVIEQPVEAQESIPTADDLPDSEE